MIATRFEDVPTLPSIRSAPYQFHRHGFRLFNQGQYRQAFWFYWLVNMHTPTFKSPGTPRCWQ